LGACAIYPTSIDEEKKMRFNTLPPEIKRVLLESAKNALAEESNLTDTLKQIKKQLADIDLELSSAPAVKGHSIPTPYIAKWDQAISERHNHILVEKNLKLTFFQDGIIFGDHTYKGSSLLVKETSDDTLTYTDLETNLKIWQKYTPKTRFSEEFDLTSEEIRSLAYKLLTKSRPYDLSDTAFNYMPVYDMIGKIVGFIFDGKFIMEDANYNREKCIVVNQIDTNMKDRLIALRNKTILPASKTGADVTYYTFEMNSKHYFKQGGDPKSEDDWNCNGKFAKKSLAGASVSVIEEKDITSKSVRRAFGIEI